MSDELLTQGDEKLKAKDLKGAFESFQKFVQENPQSSVGHMKVGHCFKIDGQNKEAIAAYDKALELDPKNLDALYNCADACVLDLQFQKGADLFDKFLELAGPSARLSDKAKSRRDYALACLQLRVGNKALQEGKPQDAVAAFSKAVELYPDYCRCHLNLGSAYSQLGRADEALRCFEKSVELNPDYVLGWFNVGASCYDRGWFNRALKALAKATAADKERKEEADIQKLMLKCSEGLKLAEQELKGMLSGASVSVNTGRAALLISGLSGDVIKGVDVAIGGRGCSFIAYGEKGALRVGLGADGSLEMKPAA